MPEHDTTPPVLHESDSGRTIDVAVHSRIVIELAENATTGHRWSTPAFDAKLLALESDDRLAAPSGRLGAGGTRRFVVATRAPGNSSLRTTYRRLGNADAATTFEITISIHVD
jgi:inhibitor of cysteine peptidase